MVYRVEVKTTFTTMVRVLADNENEAKDMASDVVDLTGDAPDTVCISKAQDREYIVFPDYN